MAASGTCRVLPQVMIHGLRPVYSARMSDADTPRRPLIYTRTGDDGTTGLFYGGRVRKDDPAPSAYGDVDEAQAVIGVARSLCADGDPHLDEILVEVGRHLYVLMAELATAPDNHHKLKPGISLVSSEMVVALENHIDEVAALFVPPSEFVVPGGELGAAQLDVARTVVRRAERHALVVASAESHAVTYLNRLSDLLWTLARWREGTSLPARDD